MTAPAEIDVESVIRAWLATQLTPARVVTETPPLLETKVPLVQVARIGGGDDGVVLDHPLFSVHAFAAGPSRDEARALAYRSRTALYAARGVVFQGAVVTRVRTIGGPSWTPYDNTAVRRFTGTYELRIKPA